MLSSRIAFSVTFLALSIFGHSHLARASTVRHETRSTAVSSLLRAARVVRPRPLVSHAQMVKVMRVHVCEEGGYGWRVNGPTYFGGLGWLDATWLQFKRADFPRYMSDATPTEQAWAMLRFAKVYGWPDQAGCTGGY